MLRQAKRGCNGRGIGDVRNGERIWQQQRIQYTRLFSSSLRLGDTLSPADHCEGPKHANVINRHMIRFVRRHHGEEKEAAKDGEGHEEALDELPQA